MLAIGDIDSVKASIELINYLLKNDPTRDKIELLGFFFSHALRPYYDCMYEYLEKDAGCLVYHLSSKVPKDIRAVIAIYPTESGSLPGWDSLEDWRRDWEELFPDGVPAPEESTLEGGIKLLEKVKT